MNSERLNIEFLSIKDAAYRYAVALLHDTVEAEDMVQDLYERLWRRRLLLRQEGFRSLVMTAIRNASLDRLRERERRRHESIDEVVSESVELEDRRDEVAARMAHSRARQKVRDEFTKIMNYGV